MRSCIDCIDERVPLHEEPCWTCVISGDKPHFRSKMITMDSKECMTCKHGQQGFLPEYCDGCNNFSKWEALILGEPYIHGGTGYNHHEEIKSDPERAMRRIMEHLAITGKSMFKIVPVDMPVEEPGVIRLYGDDPDGGDCGECSECTDEEDKIYNTNIEQKRKYFDKFVELVRNQFEHGGSKYAGNEGAGKEFTDIICEAFPGDSGVDFVLSTCMKYLGRIKNFKREKDTLKVACYMYILWLKLGFFKNSKHDEDIFVR